VFWKTGENGTNSEGKESKAESGLAKERD